MQQYASLYLWPECCQGGPTTHEIAEQSAQPEILVVSGQQQVRQEVHDFSLAGFWPVSGILRYHERPLGRTAGGGWRVQQHGIFP
jgi:hypothetical protein